MWPLTARRIVTGGYLALAGAAIAYELGIRIFDRGNSEFAGMLSVLVTLPASALVIAAGGAFGMRMGDSDVVFVAMLALAAGVNAAIVWWLAGLLTRRRRPDALQSERSIR
jgi:hypothetical protein